MLRFYAGVFTAVMRDLSNAAALLAVAIADHEGNHKLSETPFGVDKSLEQIESELADLPISRSIHFKIANLRKRVAEDPTLNLYQAETLLKELHNDIIVDLSSAWFLMIPAQRRYLYEQAEPPFGQEIADRFPDANYDIAAAGRCIALDEWTAAVFHLMRVLEHGLHNFAGRLSLPMSINLELENWKNIIDQIEKEIRRLEALPKSPAKSETLRLYSELASNFRYFKDAWRNHVSHSRASYDERQALNVWNHVRMFMQDLATKDAP